MCEPPPLTSEKSGLLGFLGSGILTSRGRPDDRVRQRMANDAWAVAVISLSIDVKSLTP